MNGRTTTKAKQVTSLEFCQRACTAVYGFRCRDTGCFFLHQHACSGVQDRSLGWWLADISITSQGWFESEAMPSIWTILDLSNPSKGFVHMIKLSIVKSNRHVFMLFYQHLSTMIRPVGTKCWKRFVLSFWHSVGKTCMKIVDTTPASWNLFVRTQKCHSPLRAARFAEATHPSSILKTWHVAPW